MIGKGKFFDIISRTADDANNPEINVNTLVNNFNERTIKRKKQINGDLER